MAISTGKTDLNLDIQKLELLESLPPSARKVFKIVKEKGPITSAEIVEICNLAPRTVRHGLKLLVRAGLIEKLPHLLDMRSSKFYCE